MGSDRGVRRLPRAVVEARGFPRTFDLRAENGLLSPALSSKGGEGELSEGPSQIVGVEIFPARSAAGPQLRSQTRSPLPRRTSRASPKLERWPAGHRVHKSKSLRACPGQHRNLSNW